MNDPFPLCSILNIEQRSQEWHEARLGRLTASKAEAWLVEEPECRLSVKDIKPLLDELRIEYKKSSLKPALLELLPSINAPKTLLAATVDRWHKTARKLVTGKVAKMKIDAGEDVSLLIPPFPHYDPDSPPPYSSKLWPMWRGTKLEEPALARYQEVTGYKVMPAGLCKSLNTIAACSPDGLIPAHKKGVEMKAHEEDIHEELLDIGGVPKDHVWQLHHSMATTGARQWDYWGFCPDCADHLATLDWNEDTDRMAAALVKMTELVDEKMRQKAKRWNEFKKGES